MRSLVVALLVSSCLLPAQVKKIVVLNPGPTQVQDFQAVSPKVRIVGATNATVLNEIVDADGFIGVITPAMYAASKQLKWVGVMSAGVENILQVPGAEPFKNSDVVMTNNKVVQGIEIADH